MDDKARSCRRPACPWPATASLSYRYATGQVWLLDLSGAPDPSLYDLCTSHADATTVPRGWERVDERSRSVPDGPDLVTTGSAGNPAPVPSRSQVPASHASNRYERLRQDLPRVAARVSAERRPEPVPSRDLAPVAFREAVGRRWLA